MPLKIPWWSSLLLKSGQTTCYHVGDDGDLEKGMPKGYEVLTAGQYAGTVNLDCACYAAATISFSAPDIIADSANGLVTFLTGDTIVIKGSAGNNVVYTIASGGGTADHFHVAPNVAVEAAGAYISVYKQTAHTNACVLDMRTGLMWSRTSSSAEKIGPASTGTLNWYDAATCFVLHPVAGDLAIVLPNILRIVGGNAELPRYHVGNIIVCAGFATAVNLLPGYRILSVTVNGADLDIALWLGNNTLTAEAAAGLRSISLICRSAFGYAAAANAIALAGYTDWRLCGHFGMMSIMDNEAPNGLPDAAAFLGYANSNYTTATTNPANVAQQIYISSNSGCAVGAGAKTGNLLVQLVRAGP
jgi:hypothetical protein